MREKDTGISSVINNTVTTASAVTTTLETVLSSTSKEIEQTIKPVRQDLSKRYPFIYLFLTTVGVTAVFLGIEQILLRFAWLSEFPWLILGGGIAILAFTGTLYKKLR